LRTFLTGHGEVDKLREVMPLVVRPEVDPLLNFHVWKRTVIHQTFMLLHELGHIALGHAKQPRRSQSFAGLFGNPEGVLWFPGTSDHEVAADEWAARHLLGGIPGVEYAKGGMGWIDEEIKELFALLSFLGLSGDSAHQLHANALARWSSVARHLSLLHMSAPSVMKQQDEEQFSDVAAYLSRFVEHPSAKSSERLRKQT
ncbi:MAG: hypothetical protein HY238_18640, partial [Acidobacteria bacterium]|nr:hypothetical protein [Acidobacteriota bacterium]